MSDDHCFLCFKYNECERVDIATYVAPGSNKPLQAVLQHLGNCIKTKLIFHEGATLCTDCLDELVEYDHLMVNLMLFQRKLTKKLQTVVTKLEEQSIDESEFLSVTSIEAEQHGQILDAFNPELDVKEVLIEVEEPEENIILQSTDGENYYEGDEEAAVNDLAENYDVDEDYEAEYETSARKRCRQECVVCGITFKNKPQLQAHINEVHELKTFTCNICGAVRRDEEYLELHMNLHEGKTENECRYCDKRFSRPVNTLRHMRKHWDKKKYQCEKCGERFSLDNMLYNHRMRHEAEENPLICSVCNQSFKSRKTYNHHVLIHQENRPRHHCTICSKSFTERYTLKMHMKTHGVELNSSRNSYTGGVANTCEIQEQDSCKEIETAVTMLVTEVAEEVTTITEGSEYNCVICTTKFDNKEVLERHLQEDHDVILK